MLTFATRTTGGACWTDWFARARYWLDGNNTSMLVAQKPRPIDLEPTGISSWLVAAVNRIAHLVAMAVALMAAALRSRLPLSLSRCCVDGAAARAPDKADLCRNGITTEMTAPRGVVLQEWEGEEEGGRSVVAKFDKTCHATRRHLVYGV
ncbi:hypothetical protein ALC62_04825 [Cyphomyrmex costatus]|uniref:Uncharacterized protein n=1 Tax=Cyphomyrmex costatus TaxID=456900 RepID=A0A195CTP3_9HYME|nr:hypothetical protein ALC62_04825 [Cyphomyrmex costatus]